MPAPDPGGDTQRTSLVDRLTEYVMQQLSQPQPQAPGFQPLTPTAAVAAARNPQHAGTIIGAAQQPAQAAFEAQMAGRKEAMGLAGPLLQYEKATAGGGLGRGALAIIEEGGVRRTVNVTRDATGRIVDIQEVGPTPWTPGNVPAVPGVSPQMTFPRRGSVPGAATPVAGAPTPPPPAGVSEAAVKQQSLRAIAESARESSISYAQTSSAPARIATQVAGSMPLVGGLARTITGYVAPEAELTNTQLGRVSDALLRLKSGAQINESEYARLTQLLPKLGDAPDVIAGKWAQFFAELNAIEKARGTLYPATLGMQSGAPQQSTEDDDAMRILNEVKGAP